MVVFYVSSSSIGLKMVAIGSVAGLEINTVC